MVTAGFYYAGCSWLLLAIVCVCGQTAAAVDKIYQTFPQHEIFEGKRLKFRALRYHRGYFGAPALATAELGRACFDMLCGKMATVFTEFMNKPLRHDHRRGLSHRGKKPRRVSKARLPLNIAVGVAVGWLLFSALDREN